MTAVSPQGPLSGPVYTGDLDLAHADFHGVTPEPAFEFEVQGNYGDGWECVDTHDTKAAAEESRRTYDSNESYPHRVRRVRVTTES